ncbi:MAG: PASTA domain-containing protein [Gemmatimonadales bacterium]
MNSRRRWRRALLAIGLVAGTVLAGYLVTCAIFPAPMLPKQVAVPRLRGLAADSATQRLGALHLRSRIADSNYDPLTCAGTVSWQTPVEGTMLPEGAVVQFSVSNGAPPVTVPDVSLLDIDLAREVIAAAGLRPGSVDTAQRDADPGTVLSTAPQAGATARAGDTVRIVVSSGPAR